MMYFKQCLAAVPLAVPQQLDDPRTIGPIIASVESVDATSATQLRCKLLIISQQPWQYFVVTVDTVIFSRNENYLL